MAKIKYSALVSDMRNKLNGSVMSKNRYGSYIRNKVTPVNPQTSFQLNQRANLASLSAAWRDLTQVQRDNWINSAKDRPRTDIFGDSKILTGQALYVSANLNLLASSTATIDTPGVLVDVPLAIIDTFTATVDGAAYDSVELGMSLASVPAGYKLIVYATPGVSPGISFVKNRYRYLGIFSIASSTVDLKAALTARFGVAQVGQKIFVRCALVSTSTGQLGLPFEISTIAEAF